MSTLASTLLHAFNYAGNPIRFRLGKAGSGGETKTVGKDRLTDAAPHALTLGEDGLQVQRLPDGARLNVLRVKRKPNPLAVDAKLGSIHGNAGKPAIVPPPRRFRLKVDAGKSTQAFTVEVEVVASRLYALWIG